MKMLDKCIYMYIVTFVFVFVNTVNASGNYQSFTTGDFLNDRVCAVEDRVAEQELGSNLQCAAVCSESSACTSYFYSQSSNSCFSCRGDLTISNTLPASGTVHYDGRKTGSSCRDVLMRGATESGVYTLYTPVTNTPVQVYCDMTTAGGGWIVWQRRFSGLLGFQKTFAEYEAGFGDPHGEYWLGLKHLQEFLEARQNEAYLQFGDWDGEFAYEWFGALNLTSGPDYIITIASLLSSNYSPLQGGFKSANSKMFSTSDHNYVECVDNRGGGGFWFKSCGPINPNGKYCQQGDEGFDYLFNKSWKGFLALKETKLMIREHV